MKFILNEASAKYILNEAGFDLPDSNEENTNAETNTTDNTKSAINNLKDTDWKNKIQSAQKANNKELVELLWEDFEDKFSTEMKINWKKADFDRLGKAFRLECLELGFNGTINPFLTYIKNNSKVLKNANSISYGAIHNAYIEGKLKKSALTRNISSIGALNNITDIANINIIYSNGFLAKNSAEELPEYLNIQNNIFTKYTEDLTDKTSDEKKAIIDKLLDTLFVDKTKKYSDAVLQPLFEVKIRAAQLGIDTSAKKINTIATSTEINTLINKLLGSGGTSTENYALVINKLIETYCANMSVDNINKILEKANIDLTKITFKSNAKVLAERGKEIIKVLDSTKLKDGTKTLAAIFETIGKRLSPENK